MFATGKSATLVSSFDLLVNNAMTEDWHVSLTGGE
jgi:hypothetical protein